MWGYPLHRQAGFPRHPSPRRGCIILQRFERGCRPDGTRSSNLYPPSPGRGPWVRRELRAGASGGPKLKIGRSFSSARLEHRPGRRKAPEQVEHRAGPRQQHAPLRPTDRGKWKAAIALSANPKAVRGVLLAGGSQAPLPGPVRRKSRRAFFFRSAIGRARGLPRRARPHRDVPRDARARAVAWGEQIDEHRA